MMEDSSDISSDEGESLLQQLETSKKQPVQTQPKQMQELPTLSITPSTEQPLTVNSPSSVSISTQLDSKSNNGGENIQTVLDALANNLRDISLKTDHYNLLMNKMYDVIKFKYADTLPDDYILNLRNSFLHHFISTTKPFIYRIPCKLQKRKNTIENKKDSSNKKRKLKK